MLLQDGLATAPQPSLYHSDVPLFVSGFCNPYLVELCVFECLASGGFSLAQGKGHTVPHRAGVYPDSYLELVWLSVRTLLDCYCTVFAA